MVDRIFLNFREKCYRCETSSLITDADTGEIICNKCGAVISERPHDLGPEWRTFADKEQGGGRGGFPISITMHDMGLATMISPQNRDATGKQIPFHTRSLIQRWRIWDNRSQASKPVDRNLRKAFSELTKLKDKISVSDFVFEKAAYIYRKAVEKNLVKGRSIPIMIAASLYAACRCTDTTRTLKDIALAGDLKKHDIAKCYRVIQKELELKIPVMDSINCVARISSRLGISEKIKRRAIEILKLCQECEKSAGKEPMGLAGAALYLSCIENNVEITQRNIAFAANVTEVTIRNRFKGLEKDHGRHIDYDE